MQLTPREFDKLIIYMMADVALKRKAKGIKLNIRKRSPSSPPRRSKARAPARPSRK